MVTWFTSDRTVSFSIHSATSCDFVPLAARAATCVCSCAVEERLLIKRFGEIMRKLMEILRKFKEDQQKLGENFKKIKKNCE